MAGNRIAEMTLDELAEFVDERIKQLMTQRDKRRSMAEINASIRRNRIVPPPGAKSGLEMLREEENYWTRR
jgi:tRNA threonylcarbamoyladenosine modification (KEOPS) complex  Pcc1 subunit